LLPRKVAGATHFQQQVLVAIGDRVVHFGVLANIRVMLAISQLEISTDDLTSTEQAAKVSAPFELKIRVGFAEQGRMTLNQDGIFRCASTVTLRRASPAIIPERVALSAGSQTSPAAAPSTSPRLVVATDAHVAEL
jgi:hypothetical protein